MKLFRISLHYMTETTNFQHASLLIRPCIACLESFRNFFLAPTEPVLAQDWSLVGPRHQLSGGCLTSNYRKSTFPSAAVLPSAHTQNPLWWGRQLIALGDLTHAIFDCAQHTLEPINHGLFVCQAKLSELALIGFSQPVPRFLQLGERMFGCNNEQVVEDVGICGPL